MTRNEFIAETAARLLADPSRNAMIDTYINDATNLAKALERADCAPWQPDADAGSFQAVKPFVDAAVTKERERCAQVAESWDFGEPLAAKIAAAIRTGAAP